MGLENLHSYLNGSNDYLILLGDRFSYSYFPFNRRSETGLKLVVVVVVVCRKTVIGMEEGIFSLGYNNG